MWHAQRSQITKETQDLGSVIMENRDRCELIRNHINKLQRERKNENQGKHDLEPDTNLFKTNSNMSAKLRRQLIIFVNKLISLKNRKNGLTVMF